MKSINKTKSLLLKTAPVLFLAVAAACGARSRVPEPTPQPETQIIFGDVLSVEEPDQYVIVRTRAGDIRKIYFTHESTLAISDDSTLVCDLKHGEAAAFEVIEQKNGKLHTDYVELRSSGSDEMFPRWGVLPNGQIYRAHGQIVSMNNAALEISLVDGNTVPISLPTLQSSELKEQLSRCPVGETASVWVRRGLDSGFQFVRFEKEGDLDRLGATHLSDTSPTSKAGASPVSCHH